MQKLLTTFPAVLCCIIFAFAQNTELGELTADGRELWHSKLQKGRTTEFTGFNAQEDAARKVVRRSLGMELQEAIHGKK